MAIVKMKKMHLLGLKKEQEKILSALQKTGTVEIIGITEEPKEENGEVQQEKGIHHGLAKELAEIDAKLSKLKSGIDSLSPYVEQINPLIQGRPKVSNEELMKIVAQEEQIFKDVEAIDELEQELSKLKTEEIKLKNKIELLKPWSNLDIPLNELGPTDQTEFIPVIVPRKTIDEFKDKIKSDEVLAEYTTIGEGQDDVFGLLIYQNCHKNEVQKYMKECSVNIQDFEGFKGTPKQIINEAEEELKSIDAERASINEKIKALSDKNNMFQILYDYLLVERDKKEAILKIASTDSIFSLLAWVPEKSVKDLQQRILKITDAVYIDITDPDEDDDIPVLLSNSKLIEPFEIITELFSLPDPRGIDPNVFMAPFYFVFFGMMLSDAGYGLILSLATGYALWKFKLAGQGKKFVGLFFLCGFSTIIWGAIFGGYFGDLFPIKPLWLNPLDNPIAVLIVSFIIGVIQIYTGIMLAGYKNIREGKTLDALMDQGLWLVLLTGLFMLALPQTSAAGKIAAIVGAVGLILTQGRADKNIIKRLFSGVLSLYDITGYLSDILSYSRLLALGLTTGVVASVINTMARTMGNGIIGYIIGALIIIGGHLFNLVINVLGAYVHSSRLQYVEFFGKFYDSGGRAFNPLRANTKYVELDI